MLPVSWVCEFTRTISVEPLGRVRGLIGIAQCRLCDIGRGVCTKPLGGFVFKLSSHEGAVASPASVGTSLPYWRAQPLFPGVKKMHSESISAIVLSASDVGALETATIRN